MLTEDILSIHSRDLVAAGSTPRSCLTMYFLKLCIGESPGRDESDTNEPGGVVFPMPTPEEMNTSSTRENLVAARIVASLLASWRNFVSASTNQNKGSSKPTIFVLFWHPLILRLVLQVEVQHLSCLIALPRPPASATTSAPFSLLSPIRSRMFQASPSIKVQKTVDQVGPIYRVCPSESLVDFGKTDTTVQHDKS